jgi:light-regulated signal transduction histidine kinase (bacteriophytochrome)
MRRTHWYYCPPWHRLFISREIVHAHRGTVKVSSNKEDGTTFTLTMPRLPPGFQSTDTIANKLAG